MAREVRHAGLYSVRPEIVARVAVVIALYVYRVFRRHGEPARIRGGSGWAVRHIAERTIHQFQDVARSAYPVLACGRATRDPAVVGGCPIGIGIRLRVVVGDLIPDIHARSGVGRYRQYTWHIRIRAGCSDGFRDRAGPGAVKS